MYGLRRFCSQNERLLLTLFSVEIKMSFTQSHFHLKTTSQEILDHHKTWNRPLGGKEKISMTLNI